MNYCLTIAYKGTNFHGWAIQKNVRTIQGYLQDIIYSLFNIKVNIYASGRTDAYVHAINQVINFNHKDLKIKASELKKAINSRLSNDVLIKSCRIVNDNFHARYNCFKKTYVYKININKNFDVFNSDIIYQYNKNISIKKIREIIPLFTKKQDFLSFSTSTLENTIREIYAIRIKKSKDLIEFTFVGNGFLRNMVRMLVGCFLAYNEQKIDRKQIIDALNFPKKGKIIYKAPGCGLYLKKVNY